MSFFNNQNSDNVEVSQKQLLQNKYVGASNNILWVVIFTVINIVLLVTNSNSYFLFSAYIPFALVDAGKYLCGMYPSEFYTEEFTSKDFLPQGVFTVTLCIAIVILVLYFLAWVFAKKQKRGWMIFALVFFSIDTLLMVALNGIILESIIDYAIHAWVIISLINGLVAYSKLKKLPEGIESQPMQEFIPENREMESIASDVSEEIE